MKKVILLLGVWMSFQQISFAQGGLWTWMNGDGLTINSTGNYGVQGVSNASNQIPSRYHASHWQDTAGIFWVFGGFRVSTNYNDLWKYDPQTNIWTWMKGPMNNGNINGVFGTQGVGNAANFPPSNSLTGLTWTDNNNDLWLYHKFGDLWKYNIAANEWTWIKGSGVAGQVAVYGTQGVPNINNTPGSNIENKSGWVDAQNNLWLYNKGNVWKYTMATNEWTWMKGDGAAFIPNHGTLGVAGPTIQPSMKESFIFYKDLAGNFYLGNSGWPGSTPTLWKYNPTINQWAWINGDSVTNPINQNHIAISKCIASTDRNPGSRLEARGVNYISNGYCEGDSLFWLFGGAYLLNGIQVDHNDLWVYNRHQNTWKWVSGDSVQNATGSFGVLGVPAPSNVPNSLIGSSMWVDRNQNVWIFGGKNSNNEHYNNMFRFVLDSTCVPLPPPVYASVSPPADTSICLGDSTVMPIDPSQTYTINPNSGFVYNSNNTAIIFSPNDTTLYTVTAYSPNYCDKPKTIQFTILVNSFPPFQAPLNDTICNGQLTTLTIPNPPSGLQFTWLPGNLTGNSINVNPTSLTTYTIVAQWPGSGCPNDTAFTTISISNMNWLNTNVIHNLCFGQNAGTISVNASGFGPINYTLQPNNITNTTGVFNLLANNNYTVYATDASGCSISNILSVTSPPGFSPVSVSITPASCNTNNGEINVLYTGGFGNLNYLLQPGNVSNTTGQFPSLVSGNYTVTITDANNCSTTTAINIGSLNGPTIQSITTTSTGCTGNNNGTASINANGNPVLTYSIGSGFNTSPNFNSLSAGNYTATVSDGNGCTVTSVFSILNQPPPLVQSLNAINPLCPDESTGSINIVGSSDTNIVSYQLLPNNLTNSNGSFTSLNANTYTIIITDAQGCVSSTLVTLANPNALQTMPPMVKNINCNEANTGSVEYTVIGGGLITYKILPPNMVNNNGLFTGLSVGDYTVYASDSNNCVVSESFSIKQLDCCRKVFVPNAFSPNNDEKNDFFRVPSSNEIEMIKLVIANRWGNIVYQTKTFEPWNGKIDGADAASGTYYYYLKYRCLIDGKEYFVKGDISLIR